MADPGQLALRERLGLSENTKAVVAHQDDVGMCHGANAAFAALAGRGFITSGSVMVPCPWFSEIADLAGDHPNWDLGVHLTLTSEWRHYRWRPLTTSSKRSGLVDEHGFMWRTAAAVRRHADPGAVADELRAQIDAALAGGIDVTHLDCHMGTALAPEFADIYVRLGSDYHVPILFPSDWDAYGRLLSLGRGDDRGHERRLDALKERLNPILDTVIETPWAPLAESDAAYDRVLARIQPGLSFLALHCNAAGDIETIDPRRAHARIYEYGRFQDETFLDRAAQGLTMLGFREMRDMMQSHEAKEPHTNAILGAAVEMRQ